MSGRWLVSGVAVVVVAVLAGLAPAVAASCRHPSVPVPRQEPKYSSGPTELVSGLYIQGGAVPPPPCRPEPRGPYGGMLIVRSGGQVVVRRNVASGHLAHILLAPGTYERRGRLTNGPELGPVKVIVRSGQRVRQDLFEDVP